MRNHRFSKSYLIARVGKSLIRQIKFLQKPIRTSREASFTNGVQKSWRNSQTYELDHSIRFMKAESFLDLIESFRLGQMLVSSGYVDQLLLREFLGNSEDEHRRFFGHIAGKRCLEVGPAVFPKIVTWDVASELFVIEPLLPQIEVYQKENLGLSVFDGITCFARPAEQLIDQLIGRITGAIFCRNCLDHTPQWPFILSNIAAYSAPGCHLLLWTDLDHFGEANVGHYDITKDVGAFKSLVERLGFEVLREYSNVDRSTINWGCHAVLTEK